MGSGILARPRAPAAILALALLGLPAGAGDGACPWCRGEPERMQRSGVLSHGPMPLGAGDSGALEALPVREEWVLAETAHLRWAFALGPARIDQRDRARVEAELDRLRELLPDVPRKPRLLDPWLRVHLLALRGERLYARFQELLQVTDADFPLRRQADGPFMGDGPFLGERDKFEVVVHGSRGAHQRFTAGFCGVQVTDTVRWHFTPQHKLLASLPAVDADHREDRWLFAHAAHNLAHMFLCAYKHFSYDPPAWLDEGLALFVEKEIEPESTTFEGEEGTFRDGKGPSDWPGRAAKLARAGEPAFAELLHAKDCVALGLDGLVVSWAIVRYLVERHPEGFARFVGGVKGQLDDRGYPSGEDLPGLQRRLLQEIWGWTPLDLDRLWREHALEAAGR